MGSGIYDKHEVRTAPHNEIDAQYADPTGDNGQRDDGEAVEPEAAQQRRQNMRVANNVPDGFFWSKDGQGRPLIKPTNSAINDLAAQLENAYQDDERDEQSPKLTQLIKHLTGVFKGLEKVEQGWQAVGFARSTMQWAQSDAANNLRWVVIHMANYERHQDTGNEGAAENSLQNFETSRAQLFAAMRIMDWASEAGQQIDYTRAARDALGLAGWSLTQQQSEARRQTRSNTVDSLYGRAAKEQKTPEEVAENEELDDDLDEALG